MKLNNFLFLYYSAVSLIAVVITVLDKIHAKLGKRRIPEDFLLTWGLLGGALSEYLTMQIIRHKTKHKKFMIGLPIEIVFHIILIILVFIYV